MQTGIARYDASCGGFSLARKLSERDEVRRSLDYTDTRILAATDGVKVKDMPPSDLLRRSAAAVRIIGGHVGYRADGDEAWKSDAARFALALRNYFNELTIGEAVLAFELCAAGLLDSLSYGKGDDFRKCYGHLSTEYLCRVLNAYMARRIRAAANVYRAAPSAERPSTTYEERALYERVIPRRMLEACAFHRWHGRLPDGCLYEVHLCKWLEGLGYVRGCEVTDDDRRRAVHRYIGRAAAGLCETNRASYVSRVDALAGTLARRRAIDEALSEMEEQGVDFEKLIRNGKGDTGA